MPRTYTTKFSWEEAQKRRAAGETYQSIADDYGVSIRAVRMAVNPEERRASHERVSRWQRLARCPDCGKQTTRLRKGEDHRCKECAFKLRATSVRESELQCWRCQQWKPDDAFPSNRAEPQRRGHHGTCRACQNEVKREWRKRNPTYEAQYARKRRSEGAPE